MTHSLPVKQRSRPSKIVAEPSLSKEGLPLHELKSVSIESSRRILVLGPSGSGKSYLSLRLGDLLALPLIHLDRCFWQPGWVRTPVEAWRAKVFELAGQPAWVMDGTYEATLDLRIPAAETIILIESSRPACLWGAFKRTVLHRKRSRLDAPPGERFDHAFIRYIWRYPTVTRPEIYRSFLRYGPDKPLILLQGARDVERFLRQLRAQVDKSGLVGTP